MQRCCSWSSSSSDCCCPPPSADGSSNSGLLQVGVLGAELLQQDKVHCHSLLICSHCWLNQKLLLAAGPRPGCRAAAAGRAAGR